MFSSLAFLSDRPSAKTRDLRDDRYLLYGRSKEQFSSEETSAIARVKNSSRQE
ncbi:hypothetical protein [Tolypothrix sp. NIES-4075]|uniref:hypothetical protein n=1 Tax=Tolypothrix sp. NIES-4075 TaxID=2005459 RepID=UPI001358E6C8|nr:hypothetical protein [Tolypothrix sp. NIES-4075]